MCDWVAERKIYPGYPDNQENGCLAGCTNGDMVVATKATEFFIHGSDGKIKMPLTSLQKYSQEQVGKINGIVVSPQGHIFIINSQTRSVMVFSAHGAYTHSFGTLNFTDDPNTDVQLECIAIDKEGYVLVGDSKRNVITVHFSPRGGVAKRFGCKGIPRIRRMAVNSKKQILLQLSPTETCCDIIAIDYTGKEVFRFTPRIDKNAGQGKVNVVKEGVKTQICGLVCDERDQIYVAMSRASRPGTGHIHKYSPTGAFLQCVMNGMRDVFGLSIMPDGALGSY